MTSNENVEPAGAVMFRVSVVHTSTKSRANSKAIWVPESGKNVEPKRPKSGAIVTALTRLGGSATKAPSEPPSKPL